MNITSTRRATVATVLSATALTGGLIAGPASAAGGPGSEQDRYVSSLLVAHEAATPWTEQDDYVSTLLYWHEHPDWGVGR